MAKTVLTKGIDVSNVGQGKIQDWGKVKPNIDFAILKAVNAFENEDIEADIQFERNANECARLGIPYGVYVFQYFTSTARAKKAAEYTINLLKKRTLDYPVFIDLEYDELLELDDAKLLETVKTFCYYIEKAGYQFGIYSNKDWFTNHLTDPWYESKIKWLAQYNNTVTYKEEYDIWQYSSTGKVPGINGNVDMNFCYLSFEKGDVNNDGKVTAADARKILRISAGLEKVSGQAKANADVNGDGKITAADARAALLKAAVVTE